MSEKTMPASIRAVVRRAYSGSMIGSREIGVFTTSDTGSKVCRPASAIRRRPPMTRVKIRASQTEGRRRRGRSAIREG
jgi:hypothetical protein